MSTTDVSPVVPDLAPPGLSSPPSSKKAGFPWAWTAIACVLLGASGVVRAVQDRRHQEERSYVAACPITVSAIPKKLGIWHLVEGGERTLDALTMRITGGTDYIMRTYADDLTGVTLTVLVLFGPAEPVLPHTPEVCYPSSGYATADGPADTTITFNQGRDAQGRLIEGQANFRAAVYQKSTGRSTYREAVYSSFRLDGQWSPSIGSGRKFPRRNPGLFKVQVQRQVVEGESLGKGEPMEQFISALITEIEKEIREAGDHSVAAK